MPGGGLAGGGDVEHDGVMYLMIGMVIHLEQTNAAISRSIGESIVSSGGCLCALCPAGEVTGHLPHWLA